MCFLVYNEIIKNELVNLIIKIRKIHTYRKLIKCGNVKIKCEYVKGKRAKKNNTKDKYIKEKRLKLTISTKKCINFCFSFNSFLIITQIP